MVLKKIFGAKDDKMFPFGAKITGIMEQTPDTRLYRIKYSLGKYIPGQFVEVSVSGFGESPIGLASYSKDYVELLIRTVGNVTSKIGDLGKGDVVGIRGPFGNGFPMSEIEGKKIIVISGGTGTAPIRSVIEYVLANMKKYSGIEAFFGFRSVDDILFKDDVKKWGGKFPVHITLDNGSSKWSGPVGLITKLIEDVGVDAEDTIVITCGPPIMIKFVIQTLEKMGFKDDQIYVSLERMMQCGMGKCGHCQVGDKYVCKDGPVFLYRDSKFLKD